MAEVHALEVHSGILVTHTDGRGQNVNALSFHPAINSVCYEKVKSESARLIYHGK